MGCSRALDLRHFEQTLYGLYIGIKRIPDTVLKLFCCCRDRAESDTSVPDAPVRAEKFAQRYT